MKKKPTYLLAIAAAIAMLSCSGDNEPETSRQDSTPITFAAVSVDSKATTRTTMGADAHETGLPLGVTLDVFIYDRDGTVVTSDADGNPAVTLPLVYVTTEDGDPETGQSGLGLQNESLSQPVYPKTDTNHTAYIFAVYPAGCTSSKATANSYTFSVSTSQRTAANVTASDLLATEQISQPEAGGKAIDLPMTHRMAKVIVKFNATGDLTADNMPTDFNVLNVQNTVTIAPKTGAISNGSACITTTGSPTIIEACTTEAFLIPPQTIISGTEFLSFDISGTAADNFHAITGGKFTPTRDLVFEANKVYEITVNVSVNYITATATITPWNEETMTFDKYIL